MNNQNYNLTQFTYIKILMEKPIFKKKYYNPFTNTFTQIVKTNYNHPTPSKLEIAY